MNPTTIEEFARQLGLEGKRKNGKKTKMDRSTIRMAMKRDKTNFLRNEDGVTYSLANKLREEGDEEEEGEGGEEVRTSGGAREKRRMGFDEV